MPLSKEYILWRDIQEIVGEATLWPRSIRLLFWKRNVSHWERTLLAAFVWVNALNPEIFMEWCELKKLFRDKKAKDHMEYLFTKFEQGPPYYKLYAWHVSANRYEWLDGTTRYY